MPTLSIYETPVRCCTERKVESETNFIISHAGRKRRDVIESLLNVVRYNLLTNATNDVIS